MKLHIVTSGDASSALGIDGIVSAICSDDKYFYSVVDGGVVRKFSHHAEDFSQVTEDVFSLNKGHVTCMDSSRDPNVPNSFVIGCSDGKFYICSSNWRIEREVQAHTGGVTAVCINPDGSSIASAGEDGLVKVWSRVGVLRSPLANCGTAITSCSWDSTGQYLMFTSGGNVTIRSVSFKQDQNQFRAHRRLIICSAWNRSTNEILTGGEDRTARLYDTDGRLLAESAPCEFAISSVAFIPALKLCMIGTANRLYLTDGRLRTLHTVQVAAGSTIYASIDQPRALIGGNGTVTLVAITGKKLVHRDCEVTGETPRKLILCDLKNGATESLQFSESIVDFFIDFNNLIVETQTKLQIYKCGQWTTPVIVDTKESARVIAQSATMFVYIAGSGAQVIGYDGRVITRITDCPDFAPSLERFFVKMLVGKFVAVVNSRFVVVEGGFLSDLSVR
jgi:intraflagellar transport protein 80